MFISYIHLDIDQKEVVNTKVAERTKAPVEIVQLTLELVNPRVKIVKTEVIIIYEMLKRIEEEVKKLVRESLSS
ncbi:hypothetical protein ACSTS3_18525 [Aquimarina muelleri]|uniref:hypothetical protein n=1 Tax=Aquimarina muelleri TaxID=279356 RepID=UPI003F688D9B